MRCSVMFTRYCFQTVVQNFCMMRTHFPMGEKWRWFFNLPTKLFRQRLQDTSTTDNKQGLKTNATTWMTLNASSTMPREPKNN